MNYNVEMPSLGADMDEGKLVEWKIKVGDSIKKGQTLVIVETQKAAVEIESFRDGKVTELLGKEGEVITVGKVIAKMEIEGVEPSVPAKEERILASPAAKRRAQELGIDLKNVKGSGPDGAVELVDLEVKAPQTASPSLINVRDVIARKMAKSKSEIPHYYLKSRVGVDRLIAWADGQNRELQPEQRLLLPAVFLFAITQVLKQNPEFNGHYSDGKFTPSEGIHLGTAIALRPSGVMTPALLDAETLSLRTLNAALKDLVERTRSGRLKNRELVDGTVTVTNVGDLGAHEVLGIIFPPQVALVGIGRIRKDVVLDGDVVRPGFIVDISLSADHRVTDGISGSRFLNQLEKMLLNPSEFQEKL